MKFNEKERKIALDFKNSHLFFLEKRRLKN